MPEDDSPRRVVAADLAGAQNIPRGVYRAYSNYVGLSISPLDVRLAFSEIVGFEGEQLLLEPHAFVTMSLPTAKALLQVLHKNISVFEERFGTIPAVGFSPQDGNVKDLQDESVKK